MNKQPIAHTIAADANISVYSDSTGGATFGPQLNPSTDNFSAITIPNQQNGAGYHRMPPSLYIFDRQPYIYLIDNKMYTKQMCMDTYTKSYLSIMVYS